MKFVVQNISPCAIYNIPFSSQNEQVNSPEDLWLKYKNHHLPNVSYIRNLVFSAVVDAFFPQNTVIIGPQRRTSHPPLNVDIQSHHWTTQWVLENVLLQHQYLHFFSFDGCFMNTSK